MIRGGPGGCAVCNHPSSGVINELLRNGNVELDGKTHTRASTLLRVINTKFPTNKLGAHNISRHKNAGHVPDAPQVGKTTGRLAVVVQGNRIFQPQKDGTEREITRFEDPREALVIIASVGVDLIMRGIVNVPAKETIEALKRLTELQEQSQKVDQYQEIISEYLRRQKIIEIPAGSDEQQGYLDQLEIKPPKGLPSAPMMEDDIVLPPEDQYDS